MNQSEQRFVATEFKFVSGTGAEGVFEGYGAVFGNVDSHGDVILPGAFQKTLADHKAAGTMPGLYVEHSQYSPFAPDQLPVGAWQDMSEDDKGLRVKGKISALDTDVGKRVRGLMQDGAMRGLSIAYSVPTGGATLTKNPSPGEAKRVIKQVDLDAVDLVRSPSNPKTYVDSVKSLLALGDHQAAVKAVANAMRLHRASLAGGDSPNVEERAALLQLLKDAHKALTGDEEPSGAKSAPTTIREFETMLREELGFTTSRARQIAAGGFKSLTRDEEGEMATKARKEIIEDLGSALHGFSLPSFSTT